MEPVLLYSACLLAPLLAFSAQVESQTRDTRLDVHPSGSTTTLGYTADTDTANTPLANTHPKRAEVENATK